MKRLFLVSVLFFCCKSYSQIQITGPVVSGGSGCPQGSVDVVWSPTMSAFTILYSQMTAQADQPGVATVDCGIEIPVRVPKGLSVRLVRVDHRGFVNLNAGDRGDLFNRFLWQGGYICKRVCVPPRPTELRKTYAGPLQNDLFETSQSSPIWQNSGCGGDMKLRAETRLTVSNGSGGLAMMGIDSQDGNFAPESVYHVIFEKCR